VAAVSPAVADLSVAAARQEAGEMAFLNDQEKGRIAQAIAAVEARTSGELVTAIARVSDGYRFIPILFAAVLALLVLPAAYFGGIVLSLKNLMLAQMALFMLSAILFQLPPIRRLLIPRSVQHQRARRLAYQTFYEAGVHHASHRAGILIFVSIEEHYVQIIADEGVAARVDNTTWEHAVETFIGKVKSGEVAEGFTGCIEQCGAVLAKHFPATMERPANELTNRLIELDGEDL
jgi:putative membrane protein